MVLRLYSFIKREVKGAYERLESLRKTGGGGQYHRPTTHSKICICSECAEKRGLSAEKVVEEIERRIPKAKSVGELFKLLILYDMALKEAKKKRNARR